MFVIVYSNMAQRLSRQPEIVVYHESFEATLELILLNVAYTLSFTYFVI